MSGELRISTFGGLLIERDGEHVSGLASRKAEALLVYLACTGRPHSRESLATMFWDDRPQSRALGNLSVLVTSLRQHLAPYVTITRQTVAFDPQSNCWLDVAVLENGLEGWKGIQAVGRISSTDELKSISGVLGIYAGDFLSGFFIRESQGFEEWALMEREHWRWLVIEALDWLVNQHLVRGEYWDGIRCSRRLLELDSLREATHRELMLLLSRSGQRSDALAQYETCRLILKAELGVEPSRETTALYDRIRVARHKPRRHLPLPRSPFINREDEIAQVMSLMAHPDCRLLTILGPGGIGKTRLALRAGEALVDVYLNGVFFASLAPVSSPEYLVSNIAEALGFQLRSQGAELEQLLDYLREKELLLILDSFEHLQAGVDLLIHMMQQVPNLKLLVTSRERLNLRDEWLFDLEGLHYPDESSLNEGKINIEDVDVESYAAVQLFLHHARRVKPGFLINKDRSPYVIRICQLLEGMPLGIELVSTWVRILPCREIAARIEGNLEVLATSMHDMPKRHRSMMTVFDHSWDLLKGDEQRVFMRLSIFRGGFDLASAEAVAGASSEILSSLVDKTLLRISSSGDGDGVNRYEIHELLRQYAARKLNLYPDIEESVQDLHCIYFADFLSQRENILQGPGQKSAIEQIGEEIENIRLAWQVACEQVREKEIRDSLSSLYRFYLVRAWFQEGQEAFGGAVTALVGTKEVGEDKHPGMLHTVGRLLVRQGIFRGQLALYEKAEALLREGLSILRELADPEEIAFALNGLSYVLRMTDDYEQTRIALEESLSIYQEIGNRLGVADVLNNLCALAYRLSEYAEARRYLQENLEIRREFGDQQGIARGLLNLGSVVYRVGEYERAEKLTRESLAVCEAIGDRWGVAACLNNLGNVAERLGDDQGAQKLYEKSLEIKEDIGHRSSIATSLYNLGKIAHHLGQNEKSMQLYNKSLKILQEIGDQWSYANALNGLGVVLLDTGSCDEAERKMSESLRIAHEIGVVVLVEAALVGMAEISASKGDIERAVELLSMIISRPAREKEVQDKAESILARLKPKLGTRIYQAAFNRGTELVYDDAVNGFLDVGVPR